MTKWTLLASAPTIDAINESITRFYCGEPKDLGNFADEARRRATLDVFHRTTPPQKIEGVRVRLHKGRYRFEMKG